MRAASENSTETRLVADVVARFGPHPIRRLKLDFESGGDDALGGWLVATCLLGARVTAETALEGFRALSNAGIAQPASLCEVDPAVVRELLEKTTYPTKAAERSARLLLRVSASLRARWHGSLSRLGSDADDLEDLSVRLAALAPGFGRAAVARFLAPLREFWMAASDLPLEPAALAAAVHLGLVPEHADPESAIAALRGARAQQRAGGPDLVDLEAALAELGRRSCARDRSQRCPLGEACPRRTP